MTSALCEAWATMMGNTEVHNGYLLHSRPFRDTSVICEFFLRQLGRVSILFKGVKKSGKAGAKARLLQPFSLLNVSFQGRHELKTGIMVESADVSVLLQGKHLYSGLYLNELLMRLLHKEEPHDELFAFYVEALHSLAAGELEVVLRQFEHQLLSEMGYELVLDVDMAGQPVVEDAWYFYEQDQGLQFVVEPPKDVKLQQRCFKGEHLLAIQRHVYEDAECLKASKRLSRLALAPHLGDKPLKSRELFKQLSEF